MALEQAPVRSIRGCQAMRWMLIQLDSVAARTIFPTKEGGCIQTAYIQKHLCFVLSPNSHVGIIGKIPVDISRAIAEIM